MTDPTIYQKVLINSFDSPSVDAFGRWRVSNPSTLFSSKLLAADDAPLLWDEALESGANITATTPTAAKPYIDFASTEDTAGVFTRQTFRRFNYQPGKALRHGEPVLTPSGWRSIEDLQVGDEVFDGLGEITDVSGVYPQGEREIYRITLDDGTHIDADGEHLWKTFIRQNSRKGEERIISTKQMLEEYGEDPSVFARWRIPQSPVLKFHRQDVPVDPYTLGAILGDGYIDHRGYANLTTADIEVLDYIQCKEITKQGNTYAYGLRGLSEGFRSLGLAGKTAKTKSIPEIYKYNSSAVRMGVLQGLMDTDGDVDKRCGVSQYVSVSRQLAEDTAYLVRSLGGQAKIKKKKCHYKDASGAVVECNDAYRVTVIMPDCPFRLKRKAFYWKPRTRISFDRYIHSIKPIGEFEATCIRVGSDDHTFLTRNCTVTHNSQLIVMTGVLDLSGGGTGVQRRIGYFDDDNGAFFEEDAGVVGVTVRSNDSSTPVDATVTQPNWNLDRLDGSNGLNNPSGITADWTKGQIFIIDFQWLSLGRVRFGVEIGEIITYVHEVNQANVSTIPWASTPNLPLRYQMITTASSPASTMRCICSAVISEGGVDPPGLTQSHATTDHVNANVADTIYALLGIRLKAAQVGCTVEPVSLSLVSETKDDFEWMLILNPTVAETFDYADKANACTQVATGNTDSPSVNTVTEGTIIYRGFADSSTAITLSLQNLLELGVSIGGVLDTLVLAVRPLTANADIQGALTWRETF